MTGRRHDLMPATVSGLTRGECVVVDGETAVVVSKRLHRQTPRGVDLTWRDRGGLVARHFAPAAALKQIVIVEPDGSRHPLRADPKRPPPSLPPPVDVDADPARRGPEGATAHGTVVEQPAAEPAEADLFDLLRDHARADARWGAERTEEARCGIWATWHAKYGPYDVAHHDPTQGTWPDRLRTERCQPLVLERVADDSDENSRRFARGGCLGCGWLGPVIEEAGGTYAWNVAAEDAHDHAWPGWRDQPALFKSHAVATHDRDAVKRFLDQARKAYPPGWVDEGGPILTWRTPGGARHHDGAPNGGWDLSRVDPRFPRCPTCGHREYADSTYGGRERPLPPTLCTTCTTPEARAASRKDRHAAARPETASPPSLFDTASPRRDPPGLAL